MNNELQEYPHKRFNPLTGEWILVSPHRTKRPWQGKQEKKATDRLPAYDPKCYLCPGNERNQGAANPDYEKTFVFDNDFPSLLAESIPEICDDDDLFKAEPETGTCRVICFSPRHDLTISRMKPADVRKVVDIWCEQFSELEAHEDIGYVQIFENRGDIMGCSNPHPHGQIWATKSVPLIPEKEDQKQKEYLQKKNDCLLCRYVQRELTSGDRVVFENDSFAALVPFWAVWPFETMLLPKQHMGAIIDMNSKQKMILLILWYEWEFVLIIFLKHLSPTQWDCINAPHTKATQTIGTGISIIILRYCALLQCVSLWSATK